jgi:uncharacterized membrane protein
MLRSARERACQTLAYEAGGLLLAVPLYALFAGAQTHDALILIAAVAVACMVWSPLHNTAFDWADWRFNRRVAGSRPHRLRLVHAVSHEASSVVVTVPVIIAFGGHSFLGALAVDIGLTLLYACYAYAFHIAYDRLRPVGPSKVARGRRGDGLTGRA